MRNLLIASLLTLTACSVESPSANTAPNTQPATVASAAITPQAAAEKLPIPAQPKVKITIDEALAIHRKQLGDNQKPEREPVARLLKFSECYQRARQNIHGDPGLQGPTLLGDLEDLKRVGQCWSVEVKYPGHHHVVGYIDESGNLLYAFQP